MRVLLADDQPQVRSALRLLLEQESDMQVVDEATNAEELLTQAQTTLPDVLLLDWELPGLPATTLLATLRKGHPYLSIIALSGKWGARRSALAAGADAFVSKTDPSERLLSTLRKIGRKAHKRSGRFIMTSQTELKALTLLRSAELTHDLDTEHLRKLASMATEVEFLEDQIIYQKGNTGHAIYLIEEGQVVIEADVADRGRVTMITLGPGQFFGWSSLFPGERKMAWTRAVEPTRAIAIDANQLRMAWRADHNLEYAIVRRAGKDMIERIKVIRRQLADLPAPPEAA